MFFKYKNILINIRFTRYYTSKSPLNALFFGSDNFSLYSLKLLYSYYVESEVFSKLEVVTNVKRNANVIQKYAEEKNLSIYNWPNIPTEIKYDVGLVVSFGHLIPKDIIEKFSYGILNVHASLLPKWRGAAPIIYAIANGDRETGITIMRIKPYTFDTGDVLLQEKLPISQNTEMPELYQSLGELGAKSLIKTILDLPKYLKNSQQQSNVNVTYAPKVNSEYAVIKWNQMSSVQVYNLHRALKGFLMPVSTWQGTQIKLSGIKLCCSNSATKEMKPGYVKYDKSSKTLSVLCADDSFINVENISVLGKKVMNASDFNNGFLCKVPVDLRHFV